MLININNKTEILSFITVFLVVLNADVCCSKQLSVEVAQNISKLFETNSCVNCNLDGANLNRAELPNADLRGAKLNNSRFFLANLTNANFSNSELQGAEFGGADISGANFTGANLTETSFIGAYRKNTVFEGKVSEKKTLNTIDNPSDNGLEKNDRVERGSSSKDELSIQPETSNAIEALPVGSSGPVRKKIQYISPVKIK